MRKNSNEERTRLREKCRNNIARHIEASLGVLVQPQDVRLHPLETDPYMWKYLPRSQHLFDKRISKHNIRTYREIIRELGTSIEVVAKHAPVSSSDSLSIVFEKGRSTCTSSCGTELTDHHCMRGDGADSVKQGFGHTVSELQSHNVDLLSQLEEAKIRVDQQDPLVTQLQVKVDASTRRIKELEATLQHRNAEAARKTKMHEEYKARIQQVEDWIKDWQVRTSSFRDRSMAVSFDDMDYTSLLDNEITFGAM